MVDYRVFLFETLECTNYLHIFIYIYHAMFSAIGRAYVDATRLIFCRFWCKDSIPRGLILTCSTVEDCLPGVHCVAV